MAMTIRAFFQALWASLWTPFTPLVLLVLCLLIAMVNGVALGQDANWDLRNYHYYNIHAWLNGRYDIDLAPAQIQTWHHPTGDLPYYALVSTGMPSWLFTALLAIPAGIALYFLARLFQTLVPRSPNNLVTISLLLVGVSGAAGNAVIGTTMSEWHTTALFLAALWVLLRPIQTNHGQWRPFLIAGLLGGAAVGLKLTAAVYALGLAAFVLARPGSFTQRLSRVTVLAIGGVSAAVVVYLPWGWFVYQRMENPFFPYFNNIFHSPYADLRDYADVRFVKRTLSAIFSLPTDLASENIMSVAEMPMRDWRLALGFPAMAYMAFAQKTADQQLMWRGLFAFFLLSFFSWAYLSGIYRYTGVLELLASLAIIAAAASIRGALAALLVVILTSFLVATTLHPDWNRLPHGRAAVRAPLPSLPPDSMVVMATGNPLGYVVPNLPTTTPVVSLVNNFMGQTEPPTTLFRLALSKIQAHRGSLWLLTNPNAIDEKTYLGVPVASVIAKAGLVVDYSQCKSFETAPDGTLAFCPLAVSPTAETRAP